MSALHIRVITAPSVSVGQLSAARVRNKTSD